MMAGGYDDLDMQVLRLLDEGDEHLGEGRTDEAIARYESAWQLLPEPRTEQPNALHVLAAIGDVRFQRREFAAGREAFMAAMRCAHGEPIGNPFLRLRLGQCLFELGEM